MAMPRKTRVGIVGVQAVAVAHVVANGRGLRQGEKNTGNVTWIRMPCLA